MKDLLKWNAEFAKNVWLEFSIQRVIAMPAIIFIVMLFASSGNDGAEGIHGTSLVGFILIGMLWATKTATDSILDEYNEKTWDWQRMSIMGPWKLTIGKLFGSTIYNWYGAGICWFLFIFTAYSAKEDLVKELKAGVFLIIAAIALHAFMIVMALQMVRKEEGKAKIKGNQNFLIGLALVGFLLSLFYLNVYFGGGISEKEGYVYWYTISLKKIDISLIAIMFYCVWLIVGVYRSLRAELQYVDKPICWSLFIITNFIFQYGFFAGDSVFTGSIGFSAALAFFCLETIVVVYLLAFTEGKDIINFRVLMDALVRKDFDLFLKKTPLWLVTLPMAFAFGLLSVFFLVVSPSSIYTDVLVKLQGLNFATALLVLLTIFSFVIRDLGILLLLNFSSRQKRADAAMMLYLILLYGVFPAFTNKTFLGVVFYPDITANPLMMFLPPLAEAAVVVFLLIRYWQKVKK